MKRQIHILKEWNETIQKLPDNLAGIIYAGIYTLVIDGEDAAGQDLESEYKEAFKAIDAAETQADKAEAVGYATQVIYAQTLWTTSILPYYLSQQK